MIKKTNLFFVFLLCQAFFAQEKVYKEYKNDIKWVASSQILGRTQFSYERALSPRSSLAIGIGFNTTGGINIKGVSKENYYLSGFKYNGGNLINLEYRYYFKNTSLINTMYGFYIGVYTSYAARNANTNGWYTDSNNNKNSFNLDMKLNSFVGGIQAGYKLIVYKGFNFDFIILGPGTSFNNVNLEFDTDISQATLDQISQEITDRFGNLSDKLPKFHATDQKNQYKTNFNLNAFRYGIGLGYSF